MAPKKVTNEVLETKLDYIKDHLDKHDRHLDNVAKILEKVDGRVDSIDLTLAKQSIVLADHIRRTEILEAEMKPIKSKSELFVLFLKIGGALIATGAGGLGIKELITIFIS